MTMSDERAAAGTNAFKGHSTFLAELRAWVVIVLTAGALHDAAGRLCKDTGSIYFLGIHLLCLLARNAAPREALNTGDAEDSFLYPLEGYTEEKQEQKTGWRENRSLAHEHSQRKLVAQVSEQSPRFYPQIAFPRSCSSTGAADTALA
ncbi:MAG: hypothetical protein ACREVT_12385 [Burkholderiales bacterium]